MDTNTPKDWFCQKLLAHAEPFTAGKTVCKVTAYLWEGGVIHFLLVVQEKRERSTIRYLWQIVQLHKNVIHDVDTQEVLNILINAAPHACKWETDFRR